MHLLRTVGPERRPDHETRVLRSSVRRQMSLSRPSRPLQVSGARGDAIFLALNDDGTATITICRERGETRVPGADRHRGPRSRGSVLRFGTVFHPAQRTEIRDVARFSVGTEIKSQLGLRIPCQAACLSSDLSDSRQMALVTTVLRDPSSKLSPTVVDSVGEDANHRPPPYLLVQPLQYVGGADLPGIQ